MSTELPEDGMTAGACFVPVSGDVIDLIDLKVTGYEEAGETDSEVDLQTLDEAGRTDRDFYWKDLVFKSVRYYGWFEDGETELEPEDVTIQPGEGLWLDCLAEFGLQSNGEVPQKDVVVELQENGLIVANPTPVEVDLYNTKIIGYEEAGETDSEVDLQTLDEAGRTDRDFYWKDLVFKNVHYYGWYEDGEIELEEDDVIVKPGQGLWTDCMTDGFKFVWPKVVLAK